MIPSPRVTTLRRQRPAHVNLTGLAARINALADAGADVALMRRQLSHLVRDQDSRIGGWHTNAANLALSVSRAEAAL